MKTIKLIGMCLMCLVLGLKASARNGDFLCKTPSAMLKYSTYIFGTIARGEYTELNGERQYLKNEIVTSNENSLIFYNQNRIFIVENPMGSLPFKFTLKASLNSVEPEVIEVGECNRVVEL